MNDSSLREFEYVEQSQVELAFMVVLLSYVTPCTS